MGAPADRALGQVGRRGTASAFGKIRRIYDGYRGSAFLPLQNFLLCVENPEENQHAVDGEDEPEQRRAEVQLRARDREADHAGDDGEPRACEVCPEVDAQHAEENPQHLHAQPDQVDREAGDEAVFPRGGEVFLQLRMLGELLLQTLRLGAAADPVGDGQADRRPDAVDRQRGREGKDQRYDDDQRVIDDHAGEPLDDEKQQHHTDGQHGAVLHQRGDGVEVDDAGHQERAEHGRTAYNNQNGREITEFTHEKGDTSLSCGKKY